MPKEVPWCEPGQETAFLLPAANESETPPICARGSVPRGTCAPSVHMKEPTQPRARGLPPYKEGGGEARACISTLFSAKKKERKKKESKQTPVNMSNGLGMSSSR